jgi:hypothetical protein
MLPLHQENQEVVLFDDEMNQEVILSIIFAGISIWRAGETCEEDIYFPLLEL